ncbi:MAG: Cytochrome oxidase, cbb3-type, subunit [Holophagaceae bacterium]|nr:Cytochrome oxidase, cbb3-type, subunit [Holophagaceae bacterium]
MPSTLQHSALTPSRSAAARLLNLLSRPILGALLLGLLAATPGQAQAPAARAKTLQELKAFYQQNCTRCHGLDGSAKTPDGKKLGGLDFTRAAQDFRNLSGPASEREIRTMIRTIQKGIFFGITMPAWKDQLSPEDSTLMVRDILLKAEAGKAIQP